MSSEPHIGVLYHDGLEVKLKGLLREENRGLVFLTFKGLVRQLEVILRAPQQDLDLPTTGSTLTAFL
ncbi:hypothetical protein A3L02_08735 [Thermococcus celer Vu 13 = JCM 8558]|uniref:Uncharacterized protein n=1 Tax=Thermococcus celer Vu 13 = JCM 8558 TaxID=1293037 RepID=A0A218P3Y3_THECE|nr:hypothetical protein A3L02_08735 [Thermococcus celer Vu 13 = JCM 8558]